MTENRRRADSIIDNLRVDMAHAHDCIEVTKKEVTGLHVEVAELKAEMKRNTEVTEDIRDILASFRVVGRIAKWVAGVAAAVAAVKAGMTQFGR